MKNGESPRLTRNGSIITCTTDNFVPLVVPGLKSSSSSSSASTSRTKGQSSSSSGSKKSSHPVTTWSDKPACGGSMQTDPENAASVNRGSVNKDEMDKEDPTQGIPDWSHLFTDHQEDLETHVPAHSSERENSDSEGAAKVVTNRTHTIETHFSKDRNCDVCLRTKITRVPCRRRSEGSIPSAVIFGDLLTADHKILNDGGESRNNHRYAVVVQDRATQWIQSYPCKTKTSQDTEKSLRKFLEPSQKPKIIYTDNSLEFGKSFEEVSWNHRTSTPQRSETNGIAERAVRRVKEGTSAVLLQSGFHGTLLLSAKFPRSLGRRENSVWTKIWESLKGQNIPFGAQVEYLPNSERDKARIHQFGKKVLPVIFIGYALIAGDIEEELEELDASEIYPRRLNAKEVLISQKNGEFIFPVADGSAKLTGRSYEFQECTLRRQSTVRRENLSGESLDDREEFRPEETKDDARIHKDFWSIQGDFIYRHHVEPRVHIFVPKEESFPNPLKNIDVMKSTHTDLDVALEKRIDDYWNVDGNRSLWDPWTGFTRFTLLNETPPKGWMWSGARLTKLQTTRPDHKWPDAWTRIGKAAQRREKQ